MRDVDHVFLGFLGQVPEPVLFVCGQVLVKIAGPQL